MAIAERTEQRTGGRRKAPRAAAPGLPRSKRARWWESERLTLEEFLSDPRVEDAKPHLEYEEGRITQKVSPKLRHSVLQSELCSLFDRAGRRDKSARAFPELRVVSPERSYVPDVSVLTWDRIPRTPDGMFANGNVEIPPDLAVEIVSPSQGVNTLVRRCLTFISLGVRVALLVDPDDESVILFRPGQSPQALRGADTIDLAEVLPALRLTVSKLFRALRVD